MASFLGSYAVPAFSSNVYVPALEITSNSAYPPTGTLDFDMRSISTDTWRLQAATDLAFTSLVIDASGTIGTGDIGAISGMSSITTGKHYFRARTERGAEVSAWTGTVVHGDLVAPTITSSATVSIMEGLTLSHVLTSDKPGEVVFSLFGGPDSGDVEISSATLRWTGNGVKDFEAPDDQGTNNVYDVNVKCTDLANNYSIQSIAITVTDNVADNPPYTEWTSTTGASKSGYAVISGTPQKLDYVGTATVGAAMMVRAKIAAVNALFQYEITVTGGLGHPLYVGVDNNTDNLNSFAVPGFSNTNGVTFVLNGERYVYHNGLINYSGSGGDVSVGDVFSVVVDAAAGNVSLYRTRGGVTVQIGSTVTIAAPYANYYAIAGSTDAMSLTANFGQNTFARALDVGYGAY